MLSYALTLFQPTGFYLVVFLTHSLLRPICARMRPVKCSVWSFRAGGPKKTPSASLRILRAAFAGFSSTLLGGLWGYFMAAARRSELRSARWPTPTLWQPLSRRLSRIKITPLREQCVRLARGNVAFPKCQRRQINRLPLAHTYAVTGHRYALASYVSIGGTPIAHIPKRTVA